MIVTLLQPPWIYLILLAINLLAFAAFGWDKRCARRGEWRISQSTLLTLAFLGGSPGALAGRAAFRHKTRKQPFTGQLYGIAALQVAAGVWWFLRGAGLA